MIYLYFTLTTPTVELEHMELRKYEATMGVSSQILQTEYQILLLAHTDFRKFEVMNKAMIGYPKTVRIPYETEYKLAKRVTKKY